MPKRSAPTETGRDAGIAGLVLLSRAGCDLCDEFAAELAAAVAQYFPLLPVHVVDVDDYPDLARRYGLDVPVLLWDGVKVCQHRLDLTELARLMRPRAAARPL